MNYGLSTCICHRAPVQQALEAIAAQGITNVEYATFNLIMSSDDEALRAAYLDRRDARLLKEEAIPTREISELASSLGISPVQVHCPDYDLGHPDAGLATLAVRKTTEMLSISSHMGVPCLILHIGTSRELPGIATRKIKLRTRQSLKRLTGPASDLGVRIALENRWQNTFGSGAEDIVQMVQSTDPDAVGACLDTGHSQRRGVPPHKMLEALGKHLAATHIHDAVGTHDHLPPFEGDVDWVPFCKSLRDVGYGGTLIGEIQGSEDPKAWGGDIRKSKGALERLLEMLESP